MCCVLEQSAGRLLQDGRTVQRPTFDGYSRRLDVFDYRAKRKDVPHDVDRLLELARDIELEDKIIIDSEDYRE
jgi:hypothetical protein